jgi:predicted amidohydrolase YtcJ
MVIGAEVWGLGERGFAVEGGRFSQVSGDIKGGDWEGYVALPGFVDAHCHVLPSGLDLLKLNLSKCSSKAEVLEAVREWAPKVGEGQWLHATQYDQNKWGEHLTRFEIDAVVADVPVLLRHSNGHASVANTAALRAAGIGDEVSDPVGGEYERGADGVLTGVLLEKAHEIVTSRAPEPGLEEMVEAIMRAGDSMAGFGITTATDMMTGRWDLDKELQAYRIASERGCKVRLRMYMQWREVLGDKGIDPARLAELMGEMDEERCKVLGLKVFADGAIGSATAAIHGQFMTTGRSGKLIYPEAELARILALIDAEGWSCSVHTIGDRSTDLVMDAFEKTAAPGRHRIEHAMILSDGQVDRLARLGSHVTLQPEFLYRFGHAYRAQLQDGVWQKLIRTRSLIDAGLSLSFNSDRPIVVGDPWVGIGAAVSRPTGFDSEESCSVAEGVDLYTRGGAVANFDGDWLGRIEVGFGADFQIYDREAFMAHTHGPTLTQGTALAPVAVYRAGERVV